MSADVIPIAAHGDNARQAHAAARRPVSAVGLLALCLDELEELAHDPVSQLMREGLWAAHSLVTTIAIQQGVLPAGEFVDWPA